MPSREGSNLRPWWRIRHTLNQQKVRNWDQTSKKMLVYDERSWNVYENKENIDKMPGDNTDFCVPTTWILQKMTAYDGDWRVNDISMVAFGLVNDGQ